jgi:hypothetical protein
MLKIKLLQIYCVYACLILGFNACDDSENYDLIKSEMGFSEMSDAKFLKYYQMSESDLSQYVSDLIERECENPNLHNDISSKDAAKFLLFKKIANKSLELKRQLSPNEVDKLIAESGADYKLRKSFICSWD